MIVLAWQVDDKPLVTISTSGDFSDLAPYYFGQGLLACAFAFMIGMRLESGSMKRLKKFFDDHTAI